MRLAVLTAMLFVCGLVLVPGAVAQVPGPTPTLVPPLQSPPVTASELVTLSIQAEQGAEFALFAYSQSLENAAVLATLEAGLLGDPVVVTDTLPSGNVFAIRREFTYGEIVVSLGLIALVLLVLVRLVLDSSRLSQS